MRSTQWLREVSDWIQVISDGWNRFWFNPRPISTLAFLRFVFGGLLLYSHLVLACDLDAFIGEKAWIHQELMVSLHVDIEANQWVPSSYLWNLPSSRIIWTHHLLTIAVTLSWCVGFLARVTGPLSWLLQLMYLHRLTGTLFGFDQIITYALMYLMLTPASACWSVDSVLRKKYSSRLKGRFWDWLLPTPMPRVSTTVATRLLQIHICVIYLFGGLSKTRGVTWWDGTAAWYSIANLEYQSIDMTWMASYPVIISAMTGLTLFWELTYAALIWPRMTRPIVLLMAVVIHAGIALFLGMATFGIAMIFANVIFIEPRDPQEPN